MIPAHWPSQWSVHHGSKRPGFNPRLSHTKDSKIVLDASLLNTQHYKVQIKGKWSNLEKGIVPSSTLQCISSWKGSLHVTLDYDWPTYFISLLSLSQRSFLCAPTKCHCHSDLPPNCYLSLWSPYVPNNLSTTISDINIKDSNICTNYITNGCLHNCCGLQIRPVEEQLKQRVIGKCYCINRKRKSYKRSTSRSRVTVCLSNIP